MALLGALSRGLGRCSGTRPVLRGGDPVPSDLTADNVDGPHARRTGRSSPLGEFLDHGLDGLGVASCLLATAFMLQLDGVMMATLCAMAGLGFTAVFWEQFWTGVSIIPKVSTTEGVTLLAVCLMVIAFTGRADLDALLAGRHHARHDPGAGHPHRLRGGVRAAGRAHVARQSPLELLPVLLVIAVQALFAVSR